MTTTVGSVNATRLRSRADASKGRSEEHPQDLASDTFSQMMTSVLPTPPSAPRHTVEAPATSSDDTAATTLEPSTPTVVTSPVSTQTIATQSIATASAGNSSSDRQPEETEESPPSIAPPIVVPTLELSSTPIQPPPLAPGQFAPIPESTTATIAEASALEVQGAYQSESAVAERPLSQPNDSSVQPGNAMSVPPPSFAPASGQDDLVTPTASTLDKQDSIATKEEVDHPAAKSADNNVVSMASIGGLAAVVPLALVTAEVSKVTKLPTADGPDKVLTSVVQSLPVPPPVLRMGIDPITGSPPLPPSSATLFSEQLVSVVQPLRGHDGVHHLSLEMSPAELGVVGLDVTIDGSTVHLRMSAVRPETSRLLTAALEELRSSLSAGGLSAGQLDVGTRGGASHWLRQPLPTGSIRHALHPGLHTNGQEPSRLPARRTSASSALDLRL